MKKILSVLLVALMLIGMLPATIFSASAATTLTLATSLSAGDQVVFVCKAKSMELSSFSSSYGYGTSYSSTPAGIMIFNVVAGSATDSFAFENGGKYLSWSGKNVLYHTVTSISNNSSWTVTFDASGNAKVANVATSTRVLQWNASDPRFACYTSTQTAIQLYKVASSCAHTNTSTVTEEPGCTTTGSETVTCDDCGAVISQETVPATGHNYVDGVCQNCQGKLAVVSFSVPRQIAAIDSLTASETDGTVTLPTAPDYEGKYSYSFFGWAKAAVSATDSAPTIYAANAKYTPDGDTTLYAVYTWSEAGAGGTTEYVLTAATAIKAGDILVITTTKDNSTYYAMSNDNGTGSAPSAEEVTVADGKLSSAPADNIKWELGGSAGAYTFYKNGDSAKWLYCTSTNNGVRVGTNTSNTFKIDSTSGYLVHNGTGRYIGIFSNADWRCYTTVNSNITGQTLCFFVQTAGGTNYYTSTLEELDTTCQHSNQTTVTVDPTCTDDGYTVVTCDDCGAELSREEIPATGHTSVTDTAVAPTCVNTGLTEGSHCSVCNAVLVAQETVPATGEHNYVGGTCSVCGEKKTSTAWQLVTDVNEILAGGQFVVVGTDGSTYYALPTTIASKMSGVTVTVADNKVVYVEGTTPVWNVESCGNGIALYNGISYLKYGSSTNLNSSSAAYEFTLTALGDAFKVVSTVDTNRGLVFRGKTYNQFGGYAMSNVTTTSTEYFGIQFYKLVNVCSHENVVDVEAVAATCTSVGYTAGKQCTDCGTYTEGHEEVAMLDHSYGLGVETTAPTCTEKGVMTYTCSVCGHSYTEDIPAAGHKMGEGVVVEATCETDGSKTFTCSVCGEAQVETIPATGHSWDEGEQTQAPTCETDGVMLYTCQNDSAHTKTEAIAAIGHDWDEGVQTQAPTCDEPGVMLFTCQNDPSHTKEEAIHPLGHNYSNGTCTVCGKEVSRFQLVTDYTEILAGGDYIVAAKVGDSFYALNGTTDGWLKAFPVAVTGTGADMMVVYADGIPFWNIQYFLGRNNCISLYSGDSGKYLAGTQSTSFAQATTPWAWTFIDGCNENGQETDGTFAVTQDDGSVAYVLASAAVVDRAISLSGISEFKNYSVRTSGYNRELYFFKLVEANATEYTVKFVENGVTTMTQTVPADENVLKMPQPTSDSYPEGYTKFVGWVRLPHTESMEAPATIYSAEETDGANNTVNITESTVFYALYSREDPDGEGQTMSYHLVTDNNQLVIGQQYIIVGQDKSGNYYAMSQDQLSGDRGAALVQPDADGVITFTPGDNVASFQLNQGYQIGSFAFLDMAMSQFLYCASTDSDNTLKSQAALDEKASFLITIQSAEDGSYSIIISQTTSSTRTNIMFNTIDTNSKMFSCYDPDATTVDATKTFLYVGVPNSTVATYYTTGLCAHDWVQSAKVEATCTNAGYTQYTCSICGEIKLEDVVAHGHDVGQSTVITEATCTTTGLAQSVCNNCGETFDEVLPALGHTQVVDAAVAATCTATGLTEGSHCSVCNTVLVAQQVVPATGHTEAVDAAVAPTCTETGKTEGSHCSVCNEVLVAQEEVAALGHSYTGAVAADESNVPVLTHTCERCGDSYSIALKFSSADLKLENSLIIGFKALENIAGEDGFADVYATFQYGKRDTMTVPLSAETLADGKYEFPCQYITPSQVGDTVYATIYGTYEGVQYSYQIEYGVSQYCYNMLEKADSSEKLKCLVVNMLYYCDAARVYTNYKPTETVTDALTEEQKAMVMADREYQSVLDARYETIEAPTATWKAANLLIYHTTCMQLRFALEEGVDISTVTAKVLVGTQEHIGYIKESADYPGNYLVVVDDISATEIVSNVYVTLYSGETVISNTICYSVESYACAKINDSNTKLVNMVKALMHYADAAYAYWN